MENDLKNKMKEHGITEEMVEAGISAFMGFEDYLYGETVIDYDNAVVAAYIAMKALEGK